MSYVRIVARGRGAFPVDMLRFLQAWPATSDDAVRIAISISADTVSMETMVVRDIILECARSGARYDVVLDRFKSFGWQAWNEGEAPPVVRERINQYPAGMVLPEGC